MLSPGFVLAATAATRTENKKKANNKHVLILLLLYRRNVSFSFFYIWGGLFYFLHACPTLGACRCIDSSPFVTAAGWIRWNSAYYTRRYIYRCDCVLVTVFIIHVIQTWRAVSMELILDSKSWIHQSAQPWCIESDNMRLLRCIILSLVCLYDYLYNEIQPYIQGDRRTGRTRLLYKEVDHLTTQHTTQTATKQKGIKGKACQWNRRKTSPLTAGLPIV